MAAAQLVEYVAKSLADNPDGVSVEVEEDGDAIVLRLIVDEDDRGRVIGRNGSIAKALRSAEIKAPRTASPSRKRSSVFIGCTFTSTLSGGTCRNSAAAGWRPAGMISR